MIATLLFSLFFALAPTASAATVSTSTTTAAATTTTIPQTTPPISAQEAFSKKGTTCADLVDSTKQIGCFSRTGPGSNAVVTKFATYVDDLLLEEDSSSPYYQSSCNLPVALEVTLAIDKAKFQRAARDDPFSISCSIIEWIYGTTPAQYGLMSTFFAGVSSFGANGKRIVDDFAAPREGYVSIVFDTSDAAAAWIKWYDANVLAHGMSYRNVDSESIFDLTSPHNRYEVSGMCRARARELIQLSEKTTAQRWDFGSLTSWSITIPTRNVAPASIVDMTTEANIAPFVPFDHWTDSIDATIASVPLDAFADTCKTQMEALRLQCTPLDSTTTIASHYAHVANPNATRYAYQTTSCRLPVVAIVRVAIDAAKARALYTDGPSVAAQRVKGFDVGCGFIYSSVPARHGLVTSVIGSSSTLTAEGTSIYDPKAPGGVMRDIRATMSFPDSAAAVAWLAWFVKGEIAYGQKNGGVWYDPSSVFYPDSRVVVHGMCAKGVDKYRNIVGSRGDFVDFAYYSTSVTRPTQNYVVKPGGWK